MGGSVVAPSQRFYRVVRSGFGHEAMGSLRLGSAALQCASDDEVETALEEPVGRAIE
ncbi:MAG: hypothetical protein JXA69_08100 [Phycisphaerae bacterium]|nr:hypothetical protein [Phycisphaerae bacterium]